MTPNSTPFGGLLRAWRERRRLTQLELSLAADVSTRHVSFLETGRASPSREMVLRLADQLDVPFRERNQLLAAAGFAPAYPERTLDAPEMATIRRAIDQVLDGHQPYPALAVDRSWNVVAMNPAAGLFAAGVDPALLGPPLNVYRLGLHPDGLARAVVNFPAFAHDLLGRLRSDVAVSADPDLGALLDEVEAYPTVRALGRQAPPDRGAVVTAFQLRHPRGQLSLFTTIATFGTPVDVTVAELALETFFPADAATAALLRHLADEVEASGVA